MSLLILIRICFLIGNIFIDRNQFLFDRYPGVGLVVLFGAKPLLSQAVSLLEPLEGPLVLPCAQSKWAFLVKR